MVREEVLLEEYQQGWSPQWGEPHTALYNLTMVGEALETELGIRFLGSSLEKA